MVRRKDSLQRIETSDMKKAISPGQTYVALTRIVGVYDNNEVHCGIEKNELIFIVSIESHEAMSESFLKQKIDMLTMFGLRWTYSWRIEFYTGRHEFKLVAS